MQGELDGFCLALQSAAEDIGTIGREFPSVLSASVFVIIYSLIFY